MVGIEVVGIKEGEVLQFKENTYKVKSLLIKLDEMLLNRFGHPFTTWLNDAKIFIHRGWTPDSTGYLQENPASFWLEEGIPCEALKLGSSDWQSGRVRIRFVLEYVDDEGSENSSDDHDCPLDEIRQMVEE
jgi:KGK domain